MIGCSWRRTIHTTAVVVGAALLVGGCRTDSIGAYTAPLEKHDGSAAMDAASMAQAYDLADLKPNERPAPNSDEDGLWLMIERVEKNVQTAGNRIRDPKVTAYVENLTCRIAGPHCKNIRVYVMRKAAFNASMWPNGMMDVWTGLLLRARNEAQVAAVIGHEVGHYLRRHSVQRMRNIIDSTNAMVFVQFALAGAGAGAAGDILTLAVHGSIASFSRDNEREADGYGLLLMRKAGYDPREAAKIWKQLRREEAANKDNEGRGGFFASHPSPEERDTVLALLAEKLMTTKSTDVGRDRFLDVLLPIRASLLRDELHLRRYDTFAVLLDMLMEDGANMAELHYFKGELHRLRGQDGDDKVALDAYNAAKSATGTTPNDIDRSMALVYRKMNRSAEAKDALRRYLAANPSAPDAAMIRQMIGP